MSAVAVAGLGVYFTGVPNIAALAAWLESEGAAESPVDAGPSDALLDRVARRRASWLTKAVADAYKQALDQAGLEAARVASVIGHAIGEAGIMIGLLEQMHQGDGALSPMRFSASVHNTASGVISIATKNTGFTTAIAADFDTPAMALYEGIAFVLSHREPVIVACADEAAPAHLVREDEGWAGLSCALALVPAESAPRCARISAPRLGLATLEPPPFSRAVLANPDVGLLDLIAALLRRQSGSLRLDRGRGRGYCVDIAAAHV